MTSGSVKFHSIDNANASTLTTPLNFTTIADGWKNLLIAWRTFMGRLSNELFFYWNGKFSFISLYCCTILQPFYKWSRAKKFKWSYQGSVNQPFIVNKKRGILRGEECPSQLYHNFIISSRHTLPHFTKYLWIKLPFNPWYITSMLY